MATQREHEIALLICLEAMHKLEPAEKAAVLAGALLGVGAQAGWSVPALLEFIRRIAEKPPSSH